MKYAIISILFIGLLLSCSEAEKSEKDSPTAEVSDQTNESDDQPGAEEETTPPEEEMTESQVAEMESIEVPDEFEDVDWLAYEESMTQDFSFVIIISTKSYDAALNRAKEASEKLGYPLDLRGLHENKEIGLSLSKKVCEEDICGGGLSYPIYIPRSDWGSEQYVSIEYSDAFDGFAKGYYIVVISSGEKGAAGVKQSLLEAKKFYKDAYAKTCSVWMGCGC
ncbi:MAG: hypothetical protein Crog4KO_01660 [Crocinitomicaceae bacterium]